MKFSPQHTWQITALSRCECQTCHFQKVTETVKVNAELKSVKMYVNIFKTLKKIILVFAK